jgi:MFS transporter, PAT family, beta-lactamase induction signal transducer AmpG
MNKQDSDTRDLGAQGVMEPRSIFDVFGSRKLASLLVLGFASGLPLFLTSRTLQFWMTDAKVDLGVITLFGLVSVPYSLKFLWAPFLDRFLPPVLGPRRGWLLLTQVGLVLAIGAMAFQQPAQNAQVLQGLALTALIISFLSATQDIVGDAYRTDVLAKNELEAGASLWVLGYRIALGVTLSLAPALTKYMPWNGVYVAMAGFMSLGILATLWAPESPGRRVARPPSGQELAIVLGLAGLVAALVGGLVTGRLDAKVLPFVLGGILVCWLGGTLLLRQLKPTQLKSTMAPIVDESLPVAQSLQDAIVQPFQEFMERFGNGKALLILVFIVLYKLGDSFVGVTAIPFLKSIFSNVDLAALQFIGFVATSLGVLVGGLIMTRIGVNRSLWLFGILQLLSNLGYWALTLSGKDYAVAAQAISIENFSAGLVTVATVAFLMSLCDRQFTTTQFALFSSLMALSRDILAAPAGLLANALGWGPFFLCSLLAALPGLVLLVWVAPWRRSAPAVD